MLTSESYFDYSSSPLRSNAQLLFILLFKISNLKQRQKYLSLLNQLFSHVHLRSNKLPEAFLNCTGPLSIFQIRIEQYKLDIDQVEIQNISYMTQSGHQRFCLKPLSSKIAVNRVEDSFDIIEPLSLMQQGLPAAYDYADYIYVINDVNNAPNLATINFKNFRDELRKIMIENLREYIPQARRIKTIPEISQLLISSFDTQLWNKISPSSVDVYKPAWKDQNRSDSIHKDFADRKKTFYKFDIKMMFQVKKNKRGTNSLTVALENVLKEFSLTYYKIEGDSREYCGVANSVLAGRFNDGVEKPKDPYSFFLHCLIGYDSPQHLGGSYLFAQKCIFDWSSIHISNESLPGVIGRNEILQGSTLFSQHHCPRSHIRLSRIKNEFGNPETLHRESKSYTTAAFDSSKERGLTDNTNPEEGIFFIAYHKNPQIIEKIFLNQLGNNDQSSYEDGLLNFFKVDHGNVLYTPSITELIGHSVSALKLEIDLPIKVGAASLSAYHQVRWLKHYKRSQDDEEQFLKTGNPYYFYSRAGYLRRMSQAREYNPELNPPSPKILRIISKTFSLWQDTWYYDRRQREMKDLPYFLQTKPEAITQIESSIKDVHFSLQKYRDQSGNWNYTSIPNSIRNGLATNYLLGHILSTLSYGCRGPYDQTTEGTFGANTLHLEPEDVLAGGEANLTFGQGKHLIEYLTEAEKQLSWRRGLNLSAQSGIGHVVPFIEEIMEVGLGRIIQKFKDAANKYAAIQGAESKVELFVSTVFSLLGMQQYFINYADYAANLAKNLKTSQLASVQSLEKIEKTMRNLSSKAPTNLHEGAQLVLSLFICLHITGEPVSIGRLDYVLRKFAKPLDLTKSTLVLDQEDQDIIDSFWIKVGEKANFNKGFFEDRQKWGNLAMGGNSAPYPQGASFNQWGHQLTVGGSNPDNSPFFNSVTVHCLRAARTIPVNAPCLGLRLVPNTPPAIIEQAAKAVLAGGAHPILLNDQKIVQGLRQSGNYVIPKARWDSLPLTVNGKVVDVPYNHWNPTVKEEHLRDFTSDGCHEFLIAGRSWFWLGGGVTLTGLQYVLNVGKSLLESGPRYIHGKRNIYRDKPLDTYKTYQEVEDEYFATFQDLMRSAFNGELSGYGNLSKICPSTLLNAFTANMVERASDFHENGTEYKLFCPQFTGGANLINSLWNIKKLVFDQKDTTLEEIRFVLLVNWGDELVEPFVSNNVPSNIRERLKFRCESLRQQVWRQGKFGLDPQVSDFGLKICGRLSQIARKIFEEPTDDMLTLFKSLTHQYGTATAPFGFQYLPGGATFENYEDFGTQIGASFDGRKKSQSLAQDSSPQNFLMDKNFGDDKFAFKPTYTSDIIENYTHKPLDSRDPSFFSGAVLDLNIDESYSYNALVKDITSLAKGKGTNLTTITVCSRETMEEARKNNDRDLLRFRMGGWSEFGVAMFPQLLEQHIRRVREIHPAQIRPLALKEEENVKDQPSKKQKVV